MTKTSTIGQLLRRLSRKNRFLKNKKSFLKQNFTQFHAHHLSLKTSQNFSRIDTSTSDTVLERLESGQHLLRAAELSCKKEHFCSYKREKTSKYMCFKTSKSSKFPLFWSFFTFWFVFCHENIVQTANLMTWFIHILSFLTRYGTTPSRSSFQT